MCILTALRFKLRNKTALPTGIQMYVTLKSIEQIFFHISFFSKIIKKSLTLCCLQYSTALGVQPNSFHSFHRVLLRDIQHPLPSFPQFYMLLSNVPSFHLSNTPLGPLAPLPRASDTGLASPRLSSNETFLTTHSKLAASLHSHSLACFIFFCT